MTIDKKHEEQEFYEWEEAQLQEALDEYEAVEQLSRYTPW